MSEIKISTNDTNTKPVRVEPVRTREQPDIRDVNHFQALLSERVEGDQKKNSKRDSKENETKESGGNPFIFGLFLNEKSEVMTKRDEVTLDREDTKFRVGKPEERESGVATSEAGQFLGKEETIPVAKFSSEGTKISIKEEAVAERNEVKLNREDVKFEVKEFETKENMVLPGQFLGKEETIPVAKFFPESTQTNVEEVIGLVEREKFKSENVVVTEKLGITSEKNAITEVSKVVVVGEEVKAIPAGLLNEKTETVSAKTTVTATENLVVTENFVRGVVKAEAKEVVVAAEKNEAAIEKTVAFPKEKKEIIAEQKAEQEEAIGSEKGEVKTSAVGGEIPANIPSGEKILGTLGQISDTKIIVSAEAISKIGNEIIERLRIMQSVNTAKQEVVITFKENVLSGTQVSLVRKKSELSLVFTTVDAQSMEFLAAGYDGLRNFLLEQLKDITTVHIKFEGREFSDLVEKNPQKRQQNQQDQQSEKENEKNEPQS
ncbi:MAG: hypothetical protein LBF34_03185 [Puniceicoccales bacterium]|jgi:hypothetical protein|nr:hypothetical protein [Puniceicoccales bacterium]